MKGISPGDDHVCGMEKFLSKIPLDRFRLNRIGIDLSVFRGGKQHEMRFTFLIEFSSIFKTEEVLESNSASWFSPDSARLAFLRLNDSKVGEVTLPLYADGSSSGSSSGSSGSSGSPYVRSARIRYPKAGTENPEALLRLVELPRGGGAEEEEGERRSYNLRPPGVIAKG